MSLHHFQTALGHLVRADGADGIDGADGEAFASFAALALDKRERSAITTLQQGRGLPFTREVQRSWCKGRARNAAYLTLSLLAEDERQRLLDQWVEGGGGIASFFAGEAEAFLDFLALHLHGRLHILSVCRMEQAVHRANAGETEALPPMEDLRDDTLLMRSRHASLVEFFAEPEVVLAAVKTGSPMPAIKAEVAPLFFGPGLPRMFERADTMEARLWHRLLQPAVWREIEGEGFPIAVAERLISLGIVLPAAA